MKLYFCSDLQLPSLRHVCVVFVTLNRAADQLVVVMTCTRTRVATFKSKRNTGKIVEDLEQVLRRVLTTTRAHPTVSEPTWNVILEAVAVQQTVKVMQESTMVAHEDVDIHPLWVTGRRCINKAAMWTVNCTANMIKQCKTKGFEYLISLIDHWMKSIFAEYTNGNRIVLRYMNMQFLNCSCYLWFKDN